MPPPHQLSRPQSRHSAALGTSAGGGSEIGAAGVLGTPSRRATAAEAFLSQVDRLPVMPVALSRLFTLVRDDRTSAADIERVIRTDVTLAANLLRIANSAFFGLVSRVTDVRGAITVLGMKRVCEVAASAYLLRLVKGNLRGYELEAKAFWTHCSAVALLSESIAREAAFKHAEHAFTCGLLHDIGKLVIASAGDTLQLDLRATGEVPESLLQREQMACGTDHVEVGGVLVSTWNLPEAVRHCVRWHHEPNSCAEAHVQPSVDVVHVANVLAYQLGFGVDPGGPARELDPGAVQRIRLSQEDLVAIAEEATEAIQAATEVYAVR